jgi:hypothetical protein
MSDIVIFIRGGVFQGALSDIPDNRIMVVDYDDERAAGRTARSFVPIPVRPQKFATIVNERDMTDQAD